MEFSFLGEEVRDAHFDGRNPETGKATTNLWYECLLKNPVKLW
jgi:hypothetical protein